MDETDMNYKCNWFLDFYTKYDAIKFGLFDCDFKKRIILFSVNYTIPIILFLSILLKVALLLSEKLKSVNFLARISSSDLKNVYLHRRDIFFFLFLFAFLSPSGKTCLNYDVKSVHHIFANPRNLIILLKRIFEYHFYFYIYWNSQKILIRSIYEKLRVKFF